MNIVIDPQTLAVAVGVAGALSLGLGAFVLWRERASLEAVGLFVFTLVVGAWLFAFASVYMAQDEVTALFRTRIAYLAVPLIPPAAFLFYRTMVGPLHRAIHALTVTGLVGLAFVVIATTSDDLLAGVARYPWGYYPVYGGAGIPFLFFFIGTLGTILWELGRAWYREPGPRRRTRLAWLTVGFAIACTGALDFLPKYGVDILPIGFASMLGFVLVGSATVFRFPLVDASSRFTGDQVLQTMADPLLVCDRDGRIRLANRALGEVLGHDPKALTGRSVSVLDLAVRGGNGGDGDDDAQKEGSGPDDDGPGADVDPEATLARIVHGAGERDRDIRLRALDGSAVEVRLSSSRILAPSGRWVGTVVILRDIRERKRLEANLQQLRRMEAVGRLAAGVAHDFNNILTAIRGHTQLLLGEVGRFSPLEEDLVEIDRSSMRAQELTRKLLQFAKGQDGSPRIVDPSAVVHDMAKMLNRLLDGGARLVVDAEPGAGPVRIDPVHLEQVIMNLVVNARDAMPDGGVVRVTVRTQRDAGGPYRADAPSGPVVAIEVADTGTGMDPAVRDRIFEPFFTTKEVGKGTGLGLATAYGLVKRHGGHIEVVTHPGAGSRFTVRLPVAEEGAPGPSSRAGPPVPASPQA